MLLITQFVPREDVSSLGVLDVLNISITWLEPEYQVTSLYNGVISFRYTPNSRFGLMDARGNIIIEPIYNFPLVFSNGLASVFVDEKIGYINTSGEVVIDFFYDWGVSFNEGFAAVGTALDDD